MRAIPSQDDIGRRDVAVDNAVLVKLLHGFANLVDKLHGHIRRKGAADVFLEIVMQPFLGFDDIVPDSSSPATV